jgi:CubicO group peptidase (beta-lactamase class C family)
MRIENGLLPTAVPKGKRGVGFSITERMAYHRVPAVSIAVLHAGRIVWAKAWGETEKGSGTAASTETLFQAGSISKPVTAIAALKMVEQGRLSLDEDVNRRLKSWKVPDNEFTAVEKVTLRRILSHSAGLTVHGFFGYPAGGTVPSLQQVLDGVKPANSAPIRVDVTPGTVWRYSGGGYTVLQQLMVDVSGRPFPEQMHDLVLKPLGAENSTFRQPVPQEWAAGTAAGHYPDGSKVKGRWHIYPEMAAAGLWTTPTDLAKVAAEIYASQTKDGSILRTATVKEMLTLQKGTYGLGFEVQGSGAGLFFSHGGRDEGFDAHLVMCAGTGDGVVVMINANNNSGFMQEVVRAVAQEYKWPGFTPKQREYVLLTAAQMDKLAGKYQLAPGFFINITREGSRLFGQATGQPKFELFAEDEKSVFLTVVEAGGTFVVDGSGPARELVWKQSGQTLRAPRVP